MALQKTIMINNGLCLENAYIKITEFSGNKHNITLSIEVYINKNHANSGIGVLQKDTISFIPDLQSQNNFIVQAYEYLKIIPAYNDAVDC